MASRRLLVFVMLISISAARAAGAEVYAFTHFAGPAAGNVTPPPLDHPYDIAADALGNVYVADTFNETVRKLSPSGELTILAGATNSIGSADGIGGTARFDIPMGLSIDAAGNVYVADEGNHTIRRISPAGAVTTLAGLAGSEGSADGPGNVARFSFPSGTAVDSSGNVYVADGNNHTIRKINPAGVVSTLAGLAGSIGIANGTGSAARFHFPSGLAVDSSGNVYVADALNHAIRKITPSGVVTTLAGSQGSDGSSDGRGSAARFNLPRDVAVDSSGAIYVADQGNQTIRKVTQAGDVTTFAGKAGTSGTADGIGTSARFNDPFGIAIDPQGSVYVADSANDAMRKISPQGVVSTLGALAFGTGNVDGRGSSARFNSPDGLAVDRQGNAYIADTINHTIRKVTPSGDVTTFAGSAGLNGDENGVGSDARFNYPAGVAIDAMGNLYVADELNYTIRKITPSAEVTTFAGSAVVSGSADGPRASARFRFPTGVAVDAIGNVYVADTGNETVRMIDPTGQVTTIAGLVRSRGTADGFRSAARFDNPTGMAVDTQGNVYVADTFNRSIRKIAPSGDVTTFAGVTGVSGSADGIGANARFQAPQGITIDDAGTLYVTDSGGQTIRKVTPSGAVSTIAGSFGNKGDSDGSGANARFNNPSGIAVDPGGRLLVVDTDNHAIRIGVLSLSARRRSARR